MRKQIWMGLILACFYFILIGAMDNWALRAENRTLHQINQGLRTECERVNAESKLLRGVVYREVKSAPTMNRILQSLGPNVVAPMLPEKSTRILRATAYTPRKAECDSDPFIAASGDSVRPYTIAVSRDLMQQGWRFGRCVYLEEVDQRGRTVAGGLRGFYFINDTMHSRWRGSIDIIYWKVDTALRFGCKQVRAYLL